MIAPGYRAYILEAKYSILQQTRVWAQFFSPPLGGVVAYVILTLIGADISTDFLIRFGVLGIVNTGIQGVGGGAASERSQGWVKLKRVSPMPPLAYLLAKLFLGVVMGAIGAAGVLVIGAGLGDLRLSIGKSFLVFFLLTGATLPLAAIGLATAYVARPNSSQAILSWLNVLMLIPIFLPLASVPIWFEIPVSYLPSAIVTNMTLGLIEVGSASLQNIILFVGYVVVSLWLAIHLYRRDEGVTFG